MNRNALQSLIKAARHAHESAAPKPLEPAPLGFATRVVAQAKGVNGRSGPETLDVLERLGWYGAATSAAICLIAFTLHVQQPAPGPFEILMEAPPQTIPSSNR